MKINLENSIISFCGIVEVDKIYMTHLLPYHHFNLENGLKYLGFFFSSQMITKKIIGSG
jgi:hypothetical protein